MHTVLEDIFTFQEKKDHTSVLLFPPLPSRLRFLIHKTTSDHPDLSTFSVGDGWARRTVLCYSDLRLQKGDDHKDAESNPYKPPHFRNRGIGDKHNNQAPKITSNNRRGARRPDKAVYVPRAARQKVCENLADLEQLHACENSLSMPEESSSDIIRGPLVANPEPEVSLPDITSLTLVDQGDVNLDTVTPTDERLRQFDSDETEELFSEIKANLKHGDVTIQSTCNDYSGYATNCLDHNEFSHVIEIYDFPNSFKTNDLFDAFFDYREGGMKIKWVNDTHALGVFSSQAAAEKALSLEHPILKTRPLSEGSQKAKWKAIRRAEFIQPVKERPQTDTEVARRMVTRALGLRGGARGKRF